MAKGHFDSEAARWDDDPAKVAHARTVAEAVSASVPLTGTERVLEYGAGTGLVTQALAGRVGPVTLADNSPGMLRVMRAKIASGRLPAYARVWDLDLESMPVRTERFFDLIVTSMVLHHVRALPTVLAGFQSLLTQGGRLCVADLERNDGLDHGHDFDGHPGFDRDGLTEALQAAGFADVAITNCSEVLRDGVAYTVFLATASRVGQ